jgi:methionine synthase I (cobalamin-dependent)/5,10-methylenetetrahydrofolate reductase
MAHPFVTRLQAGPLLIDGAMGTMLYQSGAPLGESFDALNLTRPELVSQVHRGYIAAGADIIETNTYGANRAKLEAYGLGNKVRDINRRGVKLAREEREICGSPVLVAGAVGSTGRTLAPIGTVDPKAVRAIFQEQIEALLEGGVDLLTIETIGDLGEMVEAVNAARTVCDLPIIALMTFAEDGQTISGSTPEEVVATLSDLDIDVVGANCSVGPQRILTVLRRMRRHLDHLTVKQRPVLASVPNAGWPTHIDGRVMYPSTPEYFADFAREATESGAGVIGGCCGTTPLHIGAMRKVLDTPMEAEVALPSANGLPGPAAVPDTKPAAEIMILTPAEGPTGIKQKLNEKFIVSVEIDPPKGFNPAKALDGARLLKDAGVDAINVADSPMARVRMSAMTLCYLIEHQVGIETILHFTTRDRSLMGLQSELLGAHAVGVRNILALTGDPPSLGDYPDSSAVYDVDSVGLIRVLSRLNDGIDSAGASIGRQARFTIACAVDPTKPDLATEARRLREKIEAGAHFVMTQPIYDLANWIQFLDMFEAEHGTREVGVPVLLGVLPLQSSKHAEFLHNEVPGITLTDEARARMREAGSEGRNQGVLMAQELLAEARPYVQGVYIMPSFGRYEVAAEVLQALPATART